MVADRGHDGNVAGGATRTRISAHFSDERRQRLLDAFVSAVALALLLPVLLLVALAIKLKAEAPPFTGPAASVPAAGNSSCSSSGKCRMAPSARL